MSRKRRRLYAKIPKPNKNVTILAGNKILTESVFRETVLDVLLDRLKRFQYNSVSYETIASVSTSVEMTGLSVYRIVERLGKNSDAIISYTGGILRKKYGLKMDKIFMDWTSIYFEAPQKGIVHVGYLRDYRPDRPR